MPKQTKMIKFMLIVLLIVPICLFITGIVQTFIVNNRHNELNKELYALEQAENYRQQLEEAFNKETEEQE